MIWVMLLVSKPIFSCFDCTEIVDLETILQHLRSSNEEYLVAKYGYMARMFALYYSAIFSNVGFLVSAVLIYTKIDLVFGSTGNQIQTESDLELAHR